jgi:hypothetical protein
MNDLIKKLGRPDAFQSDGTPLEFKTKKINTMTTDQPQTDKAAMRDELQKQYGEDNVWDTKELQEHFSVSSFLVPFAFVSRKSDNAEGTVQFIDDPRFYFNFEKK